jgi:helicase MOV-10
MPICQNILASGTCSELECPLDHVVFSCNSCNFFTANQRELNSHLNSKRHRATVGGRNQTYHCSLCDTNVISGVWTDHIQGARHRKLATTQNVDPAIEPLRGVTTSNQEYCSTCQNTVPRFAWPRHISGTRHLRKEAFLRYRSALDEAEKDKNNLTIDGPTNIGFLEPSVAASGFTGELVVKSSEPFGKTVLSEVSLVSTQGTGRRLISG